jgi:hypothetical protein
MSNTWIMQASLMHTCRTLTITSRPWFAKPDVSFFESNTSVIGQQMVLTRQNFLAMETQTTLTRVPRPPKYAYLDDNGQQQTWTGQGRQPRPIRKEIESGSKKLEDFLINN